MIYQIERAAKRSLLLSDDILLLTEERGCQTITEEGQEETGMDFKHYHPGFRVDKHHVRLWSTLNDLHKK